MPAKTVHLDMHALTTLRYIRASMDAARGVAIPGSSGTAMGAVGVTAAALSLVPSLQPHWLVIWLLAAFLAAAAGGLLLARPASVASFVAHGTAGRKLALGLLPSLFAGAVLTLVLSRHDHAAAIPGTWLLLYGSALISASVSTTRIVAWMGLCFAALAFVAFATPFTIRMIVLGLGFGGLHVLFGFLIARDAHGHES